MIRLLVLLCLALVAGAALGQSRPTVTLQGLVTDIATGKPLPFATVYLNGTTRGTVTDEQGRYSLSGVPVGTVEIAATYLGYKPLRQAIQVRNLSPQRVQIRMTPAEKALNEVTVTAKRSRAWERRMSTFRRELLGVTPFSGRCRIVNENAITLSEENNHLRATASEPLVIENRALGYRITYQLDYFDYYQTVTYYAGSTRFEELKPESPAQTERWRKNRQNAYEGSLRHLLTSLMAGSHEEEGFLVYEAGFDLPTGGANQPIYQFESQRGAKRLVRDSLFRPGQLAHERLMVSRKPLEVFYTRAYARSPYSDMPYAYSVMTLPQGYAVVTVDGWIAQPNGMEVRGHLSRDRLSILLPADWQPDSKADLLAIRNPADGVILGRDARLDSLLRAGENRQRALPPLPYLHTDKPLYAAGDSLWFSAYLLNPMSHELAGNRLPTIDEALAVELVDPQGRVLQRRWLNVRDGRAAGQFRLSDTLRTGAYRLLARTETGGLSGTPTYERELVVLNWMKPGLSATGVVVRPEPAPEPPKPVAASADWRIDADSRTDTTLMAVRIDGPASYGNGVVYAFIQSRGRMIQPVKLRLTEARAVLRVPLTSLPPGKSRLLLFDSLGHRLAEQSLTVAERLLTTRLSIEPGPGPFASREPVRLAMRLTNEVGEPLPAFLSVSVTDAEQVPADTTAGLPAYLLAQSLPENLPPVTAPPGLAVTGKVLGRRDRPMANARVALTFVGKTTPFVRTTQTDSSGAFRISGLQLLDTVLVQAKVHNEQFKPIPAKVFLDEPRTRVALTRSPTPVDEAAYRRWLELARTRQENNPAQYREADARLLQEVTIKAKSSESFARRSSLHGEADVTVKFDERATIFANVFEMMRGRLPGVQVIFNAMSGTYRVTVRGPSSLQGGGGPLYLYDGMYVEYDFLMTIDPSTVERIELVKNSGAAIYGARGANGVIAIYSRQTAERPKTEEDEAGNNIFSVLGFSPSQPFSLPRYQPNVLDYRDLLYWNPQLQTNDQGSLSIQFPLTDKARTLRVRVQGVTAYGEAVDFQQEVAVR